MGQNPEKLSCISIVICDHAYRDARTNKPILAGLFNAITCPRVPHSHGPFAIVFTVTNGIGEYQVALVVEHEASGEEMLRIDGPMVVDDPLRVSDVDVLVGGLSFPVEGKYWVKLESDGEIIAQRPLWVRCPSEPDTGASS